MMLMARSGELWLPGKVPAISETISRVEQISRSREELMRLLADLPEPEHELSFTDLVERVPPVAEGTRSYKIGGLEEEEAKEAAKEIVKAVRRDSKGVRRSSSGCTSGGSDGVGRGGVLLNVYVPPLLLGRSLTMSRARRSSSSLEGRPNSRKREMGSPFEMEGGNTCCWPSIWAKGKAKPRKQ